MWFIINVYNHYNHCELLSMFVIIIIIVNYYHKITLGRTGRWREGCGKRVVMSVIFIMPLYELINHVLVLGTFNSNKFCLVDFKDLCEKSSCKLKIAFTRLYTLDSNLLKGNVWILVFWVCVEVFVWKVGRVWKLFYYFCQSQTPKKLPVQNFMNLIWPKHSVINSW